MVYLDHNATTPLDPRVFEAMRPYLTTFYGNPSSLHCLGRAARSAIDTARQQVAALVNVEPRQVLFTSGATEANQWALSLATQPTPRRLAISALEHPSLAEPARQLARRGVSLTILPVDHRGVIDVTALADLCQTQAPLLLSIMLANNETGVIQPLATWKTLWQERDIVVHSDAVQAAGKIAVDFQQLGVHALSLSSHKLYGPKGCGALVVAPSLDVTPLFYGGGQEMGLRAGTENVAAIVGFGRAAELAREELADRQCHWQALRKQLEAGLLQMGAVLFSRDALCLANTVQFGIAGQDGEMLVMQLDRLGFALSSGSACASGGGEPSPILLAMHVAPDLAKSAVRVSLGAQTTHDDIDRFLAALARCLGRA